MFDEEIILDDKSNRVCIKVNIDDRDLYDILRDKNLADKVDIIKRSVKIGIMALKNATITIDTNYIQKEVGRLISEIDNNLKRNLGKEGMVGELEKIFGSNGYLENNLRDKFKDHDKTISDIFREDNINSPLFKIKHFIETNSRKTDDNIYDMLDPGNKDSLLSRLKQDIINELNRRFSDNEAIGRSIENIKIANQSDSESIKQEIRKSRENHDNKFLDIKKSFNDQFGEIKNVVTTTNLELAKLTKERQIVDITTLKGTRFEDILFGFLTSRALTKYGDTIDVVNLSGGDRTGDFIINIRNNHNRIIVKAESTSKENVQTADTIFRQLNNIMKERNAEYGIKVYENELPETIGPILIVDNKIVCSYLRGYTFEGYPLEVAYEILRSMIIRKNLGIDRDDIKLHLDNIIRSLNTIQYITGNLTKMENLCINTKNQIEDLRKNVNVELDQILNRSIDDREIKQIGKNKKR